MKNNYDSHIPVAQRPEPTPTPLWTTLDEPATTGEPCPPSSAVTQASGKGRGLFAWLTRHGPLLLPTIAMILALISTGRLIFQGPVVNRAGDDLYHLMSEFALKHSLEADDNVLGPVHIEMGVPILRFYQALYYLINVYANHYLGVNLLFMHCLTIVICFALSPFAYMYFLRKVGLSPWASGIGSFASMISVAAFGNSFEAYHQAGIVTQSVGGLFFPLFMGCFIGMLRGENKPTSSALLFAVAFLSHATMAVFATFAGAVYFLVTRTSVRKTWKKLTVFCLLAVALVGFWVFPFLEHTAIHRPVPESIIRRGVMWFTSVSESELTGLTVTGRLLDDPRVVHNDQTENLDKVMDKINIMGTIHTRPPYLTLATALGVLIALFQFRRSSRRFLLAGFCFSLMLFAGPDDYPWLRFLPMMKQIQTFRCVYLVEFFAFGLIGIGIESLLFQIRHLALMRKNLGRKVFVGVWVVVVAGLLGIGGYENVACGMTHVTIRDMGPYDRMVDALSASPNRGHPFRIDFHYDEKSSKRRHAWAGVYGHHPYCTHWKAVGPTVAYHMCTDLGDPGRNRDLYAMAGVRYYSASGQEKIDVFNKRLDEDGDPLFERQANALTRDKQPTGWHWLFDSGYRDFLRITRNEPLPAVVGNDQWVWMARSWTRRYRSWLQEPSTPMPLHVTSGTLANSGLLERAKAVLYFDHSGLAKDRTALAEFVSKGGTVLSPQPIEGLNVQLIGPKQLFWDLLPKPAFDRPRTAKAEVTHREEQDPVYDIGEVRALDPKARTRQNYFFDVDLLEPTVAILPNEAVPGWIATIDGQPAPVFPAGPDMIGVELPAGAHRLVMRWRLTDMHQATLYLSGAALLACVLVMLAQLASFLRRRAA